MKSRNADSSTLAIVAIIKECYTWPRAGRVLAAAGSSPFTLYLYIYACYKFAITKKKKNSERTHVARKIPLNAAFWPAKYIVVLLYLYSRLQQQRTLRLRMYYKRAAEKAPQRKAKSNYGSPLKKLSEK